MYNKTQLCVCESILTTGWQGTPICYRSPPYYAIVLSHIRNWYARCGSSMYNFLCTFSVQIIYLIANVRYAPEYFTLSDIGVCQILPMSDAAEWKQGVNTADCCVIHCNKWADRNICYSRSRPSTAPALWPPNRLPKYMAYQGISNLPFMSSLQKARL